MLAEGCVTFRKYRSVFPSGGLQEFQQRVFAFATSQHHHRFASQIVVVEYLIDRFDAAIVDVPASAIK